MVKKRFRLMSLICVCIGFVIVLNAASSHTVYGVLDRYTDNGMAVILLEDREEEWLIQSDELPESSEEGVWFKVVRDENDTYTISSIDWGKTGKEKKQSKELMERLRTQ